MPTSRKVYIPTEKRTQTPKQRNNYLHALVFRRELLHPHLVDFALKVRIVLVIDHLGKADLLCSSLDHETRHRKYMYRVQT